MVMKKIFFFAFMVAMSAGVYAEIKVGNQRSEINKQ